MPNDCQPRRFDREWMRVVADVLWLWDLVGRNALFVSPAQMLDWLDVPNRAFGGRRPIEVLADEGRERFDRMAYLILSGSST